MEFEIWWSLYSGKRGHFYGYVHSWCAKFKEINNPDVASKLFMHIVVLLWFQAVKTFSNHLMIHLPHGRKLRGEFWYTISYTYLLPYVVRCEHIRENLINRFKKFSFTNVKPECICSTFGFQCSFDSTPIGLNRKIVSSRNSVGTDENGREWDFFHALNYTFALANGIFSSFKEMILMH